MKLAQTTLSSLVQGGAAGARVCDPQPLRMAEGVRIGSSGLKNLDVAAGRRPALRNLSQLRRSGIFHFVSRADVAPTELENFLDAVATKIPHLRRWEMAQINVRASAQGEGSTGHRPVPSGDSPDGTGWTSAKPGALDSLNILGHSGRRVADRHGRVARATQSIEKFSRRECGPGVN